MAVVSIDNRRPFSHVDVISTRVDKIEFWRVCIVTLIFVLRRPERVSGALSCDAVAILSPAQNQFKKTKTEIRIFRTFLCL